MAAPVVVGMLDTGGISSSGRVYVAVADSVDAARRALYKAWRADHRGSTRLPHGSAPNATALADYYGMRFVDVPVGAAVLADDW